ncbi:MAG TPA: DUF4011 domain-containing protein, partial [Candidatus Acidoferrum sp.]|nr:DUF4011 domain-containing protein [Candidatus Acidoferrum sp.]
MEIAPSRKQFVENARRAWIRKLIDLSRRNNLLYYRPLKWGTLNLSFRSAERWADLLQGGGVALRALTDNVADEDLAHKALAIWRRAQENQEEKGLATMYVSLGMAEWKAGDEGRNTQAAVLLLPVQLEIKGQAGTSLSLKRTGPVQVNLVLLHVLASEFGVSISEETAISLLKGDDENEAFDPSPVYEQLERSCAAVPEFSVKNTAILGNFAFQKMAMVKDLQENQSGLETSDLIAALAGDSTAKESLTAKGQDPDPRQIDKISPNLEFLVLDADSSQQTAIQCVLAGQDAVLHGPPGTGKSQTIANLIACLAAAGKSVLFVAEKRAALQVVLKRLEQVGLQRVAIDLHGADVSPKRVMEQVGESLLTVRQAAAVDCDGLHQKFVERRERLNRHATKLHQRRSPGDLSVYELQGRLLRLKKLVQTDTRWRNPELKRISPAGPENIRDWLKEAGGQASLFMRRDASPWNGVAIPDGTAAQNAMELVSRLSKESWPEFLEALGTTIEEARFRKPRTMNEVQVAYALFSAVRTTLESYSPELFSSDLRSMMRVLAPGENGGFKAFWSWCTNSEYRQTRKQLLGLRKAGKAGTRQLCAELGLAEKQRAEWSGWSEGKSLPQFLSTYAESRSKLDRVLADLSILMQTTGLKPGEKAVEEVTIFLESLAKDRTTPMKLPKVFSLEKQLTGAGAGQLVEELRKKAISPDLWIPAFDQCWYASSLEAAQAEDLELASFEGRTHDEFVRDFRELDRERI